MTGFTAEGQQAYRLLDWANGGLESRLPEAVRRVDAIALALMDRGGAYAARALGEVQDVGTVLARLGEPAPVAADDAPLSIGGQLAMAGDGWRAEPRDTHGRWTRGAASVIEHIPIGPEGARGNSRAVSHEEFQRAASEGRDRLHAIQGAPWNTDGLNAGWEAIKARAYAEVQKPWGGATVDPRTGHDLPQGADKYAMSIKPTGLDTTSVSEHASAAEFGEAMDIARMKYGKQLAKGGSYLGIFHDDDLNRIDIDPVTVLDSLAEVETIGAYTHAVGGAYHFKSGDGFWPPHVPGGAQMSAEDGHWAGPGQWHSHAVAVQQPHDEPEDADTGLAAQVSGDTISAQLDLAQGNEVVLASLDEYLNETLPAMITGRLTTITGQVDLAALHGHHIPGSAYTFRHGWIPLVGAQLIDKYPAWIAKRHEKAMDAETEAARHVAAAAERPVPDAQRRHLSAAQRKTITAQQAPGGGMRAETTPRSTAAGPGSGRAAAAAAFFQTAMPPPQEAAPAAGMRAAVMVPAARPGSEGEKIAAQDPALATLAAPGMSADAVKAYIDARVAIEVARQTGQITARQEEETKAAIAQLHLSQQKIIATVRRQYIAAADDEQHSVRTKLVMNHLFTAAGVAVVIGSLAAGMSPVMSAMAAGIVPLVNIVHDYVRSL